MIIGERHWYVAIVAQAEVKEIGFLHGLIGEQHLQLVSCRAFHGDQWLSPDGKDGNVLALFIQPPERQGDGYRDQASTKCGDRREKSDIHNGLPAKAPKLKLPASSENLPGRSLRD